ncbi:hypothetical protein ES708_07472 [subsurface metagenome]
MVPLLDLLPPFQVLRQLLSVFPSSAVDPGEHGVSLVPPPIGTGNRKKLEGIGAEVPGILYVRTPAEIGEGILGVHRDLLLLGKFPDQLELVGLIRKHLYRFFPRHGLAGEGILPPNDFPHPLLDLFEVFGLQRLRKVEIVVEPILDRRPDGDLGAGKQLQHRLGHDMGGGMADLQ